MSDVSKTNDLIEEARGLIPDFEGTWGAGKRSVNLDMIERLADALEAATRERDAAVAAIERVRGVLSEWESRQERNREILGSGALGHLQSIDCTGDLRAALGLTAEQEGEKE